MDPWVVPPHSEGPDWRAAVRTTLLEGCIDFLKGCVEFPGQKGYRIVGSKELQDQGSEKFHLQNVFSGTTHLFLPVDNCVKKSLTNALFEPSGGSSLGLLSFATFSFFWSSVSV